MRYYLCFRVNYLPNVLNTSIVLFQFREPHTRGSSHGQSRLIRSGYTEKCFAELMPHAFKMWRQAEAETNEKLIE